MIKYHQHTLLVWAILPRIGRFTLATMNRLSLDDANTKLEQQEQLLVNSEKTGQNVILSMS